MRVEQVASALFDQHLYCRAASHLRDLPFVGDSNQCRILRLVGLRLDEGGDIFRLGESS
jgi:hypothetical protein